LSLSYIRPFFVAILGISLFLPVQAKAITVYECVLTIVGYVKRPARSARALKPAIEGLEERIDPAMIDPVYGNKVREILEVVSANTRQPVVNADVTVSTEGTVYPGGKGTTGVDGVFRGIFENTDDVFYYDEKTVYVPPVYEYHYGYNPVNGQYEYFYGYNPNSGYYKQEYVPVYDYTTRYRVTIKAPGFETFSKMVDVNFSQSPSQLKATLALTLENPPEYAAAFATTVVEAALHRPPSAEDIATLSNALRSQTPDQVALSVLQTIESKQSLVTENYQFYVGGKAPAKFNREMLNFIVNSNNEDGLVYKIVLSPQYTRARGGNRPRALATSLYQTLLGRAPNQRELRAAVSQLGRANTKQALVLQLIRNPEHRVRDIVTWSQTYVGATPRAEDTRELLQQWNEGATTLTIRSQILGKRAY